MAERIGSSSSGISTHRNKALFGEQGIATYNRVAQSEFQRWAEPLIIEPDDIYHRTLKYVNNVLKYDKREWSSDDLIALYKKELARQINKG